MARLPRLVVPDYPHHVTQRGVRSMDIFDHDQDRLAYLEFMKEEALRYGVTFLAWCLMTNHVHLIAIPAAEDSLARAIGEAHNKRGSDQATLLYLKIIFLNFILKITL